MSGFNTVLALRRLEQEVDALGFVLGAPNNRWRDDLGDWLTFDIVEEEQFIQTFSNYGNCIKSQLESNDMMKFIENEEMLSARNKIMLQQMKRDRDKEIAEMNC